MCLQITMDSRTTPVRFDPVTGKKIPPPVLPKPVKMTATRLTKANFPKPPPAPQPSIGLKSTEEELDALTDLLMKNLENTSDPDFFGEFVLIFIVDASLLFFVRTHNIACVEMFCVKIHFHFFRDCERSLRNLA